MRTLFVAAMLLAAAIMATGFAPAGVGLCAEAGGQSSTSGDKPAVYVADFEVDVQPPAAGVLKPEDDPRKQAGRLVETMSTRVVAALQKAGYTATRLHRGDVRPESGVRIGGLFAEVDKENHWRRAVIRTATDSGKIEALVSVANLSKPEQKLYEIAQLKDNEDKPGAVITLSPYVPLTKYELGKDATDDDFQKIAAKIVNDLTALVSANPAAVSQ